MIDLMSKVFNDTINTNTLFYKQQQSEIGKKLN